MKHSKPYTRAQFYAVRLGLVAHATQMMADHPDDERVSRYAFLIMQEDPSDVLDRMNGIKPEPEEMVPF